jgi:hypothetical protein
MYWEAEALLARGMEQEGNTLLHVLATDWRAYNASWTAIRRLARLTERDKGAQAAADWLRAQVWAPACPAGPPPISPAYGRGRGGPAAALRHRPGPAARRRHRRRIPL